MDYDYKAVGGPERGKPRRGTTTASERAAAALEEIIRREAARGWEYLRTEVVPVVERRGWLARREVLQCSVLIFRRPVPGAEPEPAAEPMRTNLFRSSVRDRGAQAKPPTPEEIAAAARSPAAEPVAPRMPPRTDRGGA